VSRFELDGKDDRAGELEPGQMRTQAVVHSAAEGQHGRRIFASEVQTIGIDEDGRIAVGGGGVGDDERTCRNADSAEFDVYDGFS
jgi:hypothetical protein